MIESALAFHAVEWPAPDARLRGRVVWLRGWLVGKPGSHFVDIRALGPGGVHLGVLGLPRVDLAAHFRAAGAWLPAGFVIGVSLADGPATLHLEVQDEHGRWVALQTISFVVAADGAAEAGTLGLVASVPGGSSTERTPHLPFHGHLDQPGAGATRQHGGLTVFGWLLHASAPLRRVTATFDGRSFFPLHHSLADAALAVEFPLAATRSARVRGQVPAPATLATPALLRVYAELADGSVHLCVAKRVAWPREAAAPPLPAGGPAPRVATLPALPSGRPRRLLLALRTLRSEDATLRALDLARFLRGTGRWVARVVGTEDGDLRAAFEAAGCPVQLLDVGAWVDSGESDANLARLDSQVWWGHLDAVALFDPVSQWAGRLARRHGLAVFEDPSGALAWAAPADSRLAFDAAAPLVAPIRGLAVHGAGTLVQAAVADPTGAPVVLTDWRDHADETLLATALPQAPRLSCGDWPERAAACVCPAFAAHPHHRLLTAAASGVSVMTTPSPLLVRLFAHGEVTFVPPGDPLALHHALADLAANPAAAARRAAAAQRVVLEACEPAAQMTRWLGALESAAAAR